MDHFNALTPAEAERIALLVEECAEVIGVCGKILRHGYESRNPLEETSPTNRRLLEIEVSHVLHAIDRMKLAADLDVARVERAKHDKAHRVGRWLHHQEEAPRG